MIRTVILAALALVCAASNAEARQRHRTYLAHPDCNVTMPCEGVAPSPRGEKIAKAVGFGVAQKVYTPRAAARGRAGHASAAIQPAAPHGPSVAAVLPSGCSGLRSGRFGWRRTGSNSLGRAIGRHGRGSPASCVRARGVSRWRHLAGLRRQFRHQTRIHARSIAGYVTVNPRGGSV